MTYLIPYTSHLKPYTPISMKRKTDNFNKFYNKKSGGAIKEQFRQEKKAAKKERKEAIDKRFEEKRRLKAKGDNPEANKAGEKTERKIQGHLGKTDLIPLNKYIAHGGICSRRDAAELVKLGKVSVNGKIVTDPGTKVSREDVVKANDKKVVISRNFV